MAFGTAQPQTFLARVSRTLASFDSAWKAKAPDPGQFYPPQPNQWGGFLQFPGWAALEARGNSNTVDEKRAKLAVQSPWVFSDVSAIANEASAAELVVKERKPDGLEDIENHEAELLWESPNPHMGRSFLISFWIWSYVLSSKAYLYWMPDSSGHIREIWPIPPFMIAPIPDEKDFIRGYAFRSNPASAAIHIPAEYVTFSHSVNIFDIRDGLGFLVAAMLGIESDLAMERWNRNFFEESNGIPDGLISVPRDTLDNDLIRIRQEIRDYFGGTKRGVGVARTGDMEYKAWSRSQKEIEFKEGIELISKVIGRTLGFPDGYWSETANRANAEQARKTMIAGAVWPLLVRLAEDMNAQTIRRWWGAQFRAEFKDIRPEDRELKLKEMQFFSTIETVDELRKRNGIEPIGDVRGLMLLAELNKGAPTPTSAPGQAIEDALAEQEAAAMAAMPDVEATDPALAEEEALPPEADDGAPLEEEEMKATDAARDTLAGAIPFGVVVEGDTDFDRLLASPRSQQWLAQKSEQVSSDLAASDLSAWKRKAIKSVKAGKPANVKFESDAIPEQEQTRIREALEAVQDIAGVIAVFDVKAADDALLDTLIDEELTAALAWAQKATQDE